MPAVARAAVRAGVAGIALLVSMPAVALPPPRESTARPTGTPAPIPTGVLFPVGTPIFFIVDEPVNSGKTQPGTSVPIHLRDPLVVNHVTLAPAGTTGSLTVVATQHARAPDTDGAVEIRIEPLVLPSGKVLPLRAVHEYLTRELSAGQVSTRGVMDQTEDVFVPYLAIYQAFRKGHELLIPRDSVIRVQTAATIDAHDPSAIAITTAAPISIGVDVPHSDFTPIPLATPYPVHPNAKFTVRPRPRPSPTTAVTPEPSGSPESGASPAASVSPVPSAATTPAPSQT